MTELILIEQIELSNDLQAIFGFALSGEANALFSQNTMSIWKYCLLDLYGEVGPEYGIEYMNVEDIHRKIQGNCSIPLQTYNRGFKSFNRFLVDEDGKITEESLLLKVHESQRETIAAFLKGVRDYCYSKVI